MLVPVTCRIMIPGNITVTVQWSEDEEELSDRDAELHQDEVAPPPAKRSMRMYADDIEDELRSKRSNHLFMLQSVWQSMCLP